MDVRVLVFVLLSFSFFKYCHTNEDGSDCSDMNTCTECTSHGSWLFGLKCRWCPLEKTCHGVGSSTNQCTLGQNIKDPSMCYDVVPKSDYSHDKAVMYANLSAAAYSNDPQMCIDAMIPNRDIVVWDVIGAKCEGPFVEYDDCLALVAIDRSEHQIFVVFSGSHASTKQVVDIISQTPFQARRFKNIGKVHGYFKNTFDKLYPCIKDSVLELIKGGDFENADLVLTGHSLGGALASLTSVAFAMDTSKISRSSISLYTFGQPRVGNKIYSYNFDQKVTDSWRVVSKLDVFSVIPPQLQLNKYLALLSGNNMLVNLMEKIQDFPNMPYHHHTQVYYPNENMDKDSYVKCNGSEFDEQCRMPIRDYLSDFKNLIDNHRYYFGINVPAHCNANILSKTKRSVKWKFTDYRCKRIPVNRPSDQVAGTDIIRVNESICTFEKDFCGWTRGTEGNLIIWLRSKGPTDDKRRTGPTTDRNNDKSGYFIYVDATRNTGRKAILRSPNFPIRTYCFEMFYHMYGVSSVIRSPQHTGTLHVRAHLGNSKKGKDIFTRSGNQGKEWVRMACTIQAEAMNSTFYLTLMAEVGESYLSDIAVDDVSVTPGRCSAEECHPQNGS